MRSRSRAESSTVPLPRTRFLGSPENFSAARVSTSTGLVTITITASGATSSRFGISARQISTLVPASSSLVWPGFCLAPAVIAMTSAPAQICTSSEPSTSAGGTEQQAVPQVEDLGFDLLRVHVVQHDVVRDAADQAGVGQRRADGSGTDDGHFVSAKGDVTHACPPFTR